MAEFVKYIGTSHVRKITRDDWSKIPDNPIDHETLVWNAANGWTIPRSKISDEAWPYIKADGEFVVVGEDLRSTVNDDSETIDVKAYPPLMTAAGAEDYDSQVDAAVTENEQLDNESGSVSVDENTDKPNPAE